MQPDDLRITGALLACMVAMVTLMIQMGREFYAEKKEEAKKHNHQGSAAQNDEKTGARALS